MNKLQRLIERWGKEKLNKITKYPSIPTLHKINSAGILTDEINVHFGEHETVYVTEKVDGTNIRIICLDGEFIVGSREELFYFDSSVFIHVTNKFLGFIDIVKPFLSKPKWTGSIPCSDKLMVIYGELYGAGVGSNHKNYSENKVNFRVFDALEFEDLSVFELEIEEISRWRERQDRDGIFHFSQPFVLYEDIRHLTPDYEFVPIIPILNITDFAHEAVLAEIHRVLPQTNCSVGVGGLLRPEGLIIRNMDRTKIAKLRIEDYEKAIRKKISR